MTRRDVIARMARETGWSQAAAERGLRALLHGIRASLKRGDPVRLVGFGTFTVARRQRRTAQHARYGRQLGHLAGRQAGVPGHAPRFRASRELKQALG